MSLSVDSNFSQVTRIVETRRSKTPSHFTDLSIQLSLEFTTKNHSLNMPRGAEYSDGHAASDNPIEAGENKIAGAVSPFLLPKPFSRSKLTITRTQGLAQKSIVRARLLPYRPELRR